VEQYGQNRDELYPGKPIGGGGGGGGKIRVGIGVGVV
jgi:hypothetical protein